jgi:uncharacterized protein YjaZ
MKTITTPKYDIYNFVHKGNTQEQNVDKLITGICDEIPEIEGVGFAGYLDKEGIEFQVKRLMNAEQNNIFFGSNEEKEKRIYEIVKTSISRINQHDSEKKHIFIFPTFENFIIEKMFGSTGVCSWFNTILIFLNTDTPRWEEALEWTVTHEYAHSVSTIYPESNCTLIETLFFEGIAEHFAEHNILNFKSFVGTSLSKEKAKEIFVKTKKDHNVADFDLYCKMFFGKGEYPNWAGYSIGYYLVEEYLKDKKVNWDELLRMNPKDIKLEFK